MIDIASIDNYISQHGQFCLLDWLLAENLIAYANYEAWRYGEIEYLDERINLDRDELTELMTKSFSCCKKLKLDSEAQSYYQWGADHQKQLKISKTPGVGQGLSTTWLAPQDAPQMDLFMDNTAAIVENQVVDSLANREFDKADKALLQLSEFNPQHKKLGGYRDLVNYGRHMTASPIIAIEALDAEFAGVDKEVAPLAKELLSAKHRDFLSFAWRRLANSYTESDNCSPEINHQHSYCLLQIPDWEALQSCLQDNPVLYQNPVLMERLAQVYSHTKKAQLFVLMWGLMFERFPDEAETMLGKTGTLLVALWDGFLAFDDDCSERYFLGYLLIQQPGLIHWLEKLPQQEGAVLKQPINQWVLALVKARLNGENEKPYREQLKLHCPAILDFYLNKRDWQSSIRKGL